MSFIYQPNAAATQVLSVSKTLVGNNTAGIQVPIFAVTGTVRFYRLWGVVTTVIGGNMTATYFQINDGTATPLAAGTVMTSKPVGTVIQKTGLAAAAITLTDSVAGAVVEPAAANAPIESMFEVTQKTGGAGTNIEFVYSTTAAPITGAIQFFCEFMCVSANGAVATV